MPTPPISLLSLLAILIILFNANATELITITEFYYSPLSALPKHDATLPTTYICSTYIPLTASLFEGSNADHLPLITRINSYSFEHLSENFTSDDDPGRHMSKIDTLVRVIDEPQSGLLDSFDILKDPPPNIPLSHQTKHLNWGSSIYPSKLPAFLQLNVTFVKSNPDQPITYHSTKFTFYFPGDVALTAVVSWYEEDWDEAAMSFTTPPIMLTQLPASIRGLLPSSQQHSLHRVIPDPNRVGRFHFGTEVMPNYILCYSGQLVPFSITFSLIGPYHFVPFKEPISHILNSNYDENQNPHNPNALYHFLPKPDQDAFDKIVADGKPFCLINQRFPVKVETRSNNEITLSNLAVEFFHTHYTCQTGGVISTTISCYNLAVISPLAYYDSLSTSTVAKDFTVAVKYKNAHGTVDRVHRQNVSQLFRNISPQTMDCAANSAGSIFIRCVFLNPFKILDGATMFLLDHGSILSPHATVTLHQIGKVPFHVSSDQIFLSGPTFAWNQTIPMRGSLVDPTTPIILDIAFEQGSIGSHFTIFYNSTAPPFDFRNEPAWTELPAYTIPFTFANSKKINFRSISDSFLALHPHEFVLKLSLEHGHIDLTKPVDLALYFPQRYLQFNPTTLASNVAGPECYLDQSVITISFATFNNHLTSDLVESKVISDLSTTPHPDILKLHVANLSGISTPSSMKCNFGVAYHPLYRQGEIPSLLFFIDMFQDNNLVTSTSPLPTSFTLTTVSAPRDHKLAAIIVVTCIVVSLSLTAILRYIAEIQQLLRRMFPCCFTDFAKLARHRNFINAKVQEAMLKLAENGEIRHELKNDTKDDLVAEIQQLSELIAHKDQQKSLLWSQIKQQEQVETHQDMKACEHLIEEVEEEYKALQLQFDPTEPICRNRKGLYRHPPVHQ